MAISTYAELQTAIADTLNRDDLTTVIPTFISLAESQIARDLRHWRQHKRISTTIDERYETLPSDFLRAESLVVDNKYTLEYISQGELSRRRMASTEAGEPRYYTFNSNELEFYPTPDEGVAFAMVYFARIPSLSDSDTSNWLLDIYPDIYLYGALVHTAPYLHEDVRLNTWATLYRAAIDQLNSESDKAKYSGSRLVLRNK